MGIRELYEAVLAGQNVRANLIELKKEIKNEANKRAFAYLLAGDYEVLAGLLKNEDAKTRKNAALILGEMECDEMLPQLVKAYTEETQMFVRSDYLKAIENYDYRRYLPELKARLNELTAMPQDAGNAKHIREESSALQQLILKYEKPKKHKFIGYEQEQEIILLTNRNHRNITQMQLDEEKVTMLAGGLRVHTTDLRRILPIRTYSELLFPMKVRGILKGKPEEVAAGLVASGLQDFLEDNHAGKGPFYFRIEMKSKMPLDKKSIYLKKLSAALEHETSRALVNSTSDYEVELRLVENKEGAFIPLLKLFTIPDRRFTYRGEVVATSVSPVNAALFMKLAENYLKDDAQVLDPFCGVGTMLIERNAIKPANPLYGIDIFGEAIEKARENTDRAGIVVNYINRDFFDFRHDYLFDEIVTNMPVVSKSKDEGQIGAIYTGFFAKLPEVLKKDGTILMYTAAPNLVTNCLKKHPECELLESFVINDREGSVLFIIRFHG